MLPRLSLAIRVVMPRRRNTGSLPHSRLSAQSANRIPACHSAQRSATLPASSLHVKPLQANPTSANWNMMGNNTEKQPRQQISEPMEHRRAQMLRRKTRHSGRSGQGDACEEHAQGNGETPVRAMRHQARTRREGGIPPTKHRDANGVSSRGRSRAFPQSERRACVALTQLPRVHCAVTVGVLPSGTLLGEADCTGLDPEAVYVYGERVEGRARRPPQRASTVAPTVTARCLANQH